MKLVQGEAVLDGDYRYTLRRAGLGGDGVVVFVMLNPSTATATTDDATIRRCIGYAKAWGYAELVVVNLYAYRTVSPAVLKAKGYPVGPDNDVYIAQIARTAKRVVAAWGSHAQPTRAKDVLGLLGEAHPSPVMALGFTKAGMPVHPLRQRADQKLVEVPR